MKITDYAETIDVEYRSPEWHEARRESIAASEIAAVLGLSPWTSPFDLWWLKRTGDDSQTESKAMRRGRRYEALILEDFAAEHPEFRVAPSVTVRSTDRPWQVATPDGLAYETGTMPAVPDLLAAAGLVPVATVEAKTGQRHEWGEPGTDDVPVHYRCQVLWQMDVLGVNVAYLPVLFGDTYAEYVVEYDEADAKVMRDAAEAFLASVREDRMPDVDGSTATLRRLKRLHPSLTDEDADIPATLVRQYQLAQRLEKAAADRKRLAENRIRHHLGAAQRGVIDGRKVVSRSLSEIPESVRRAYTRDSLYVTRKDLTS